jgi:3-oxoacyl-[acyl-carrier protein] reductase
MKIDQVRALVTGGSSGIGYEIANQIRQRGGSVAICARDGERVATAAREIGAVAIEADVSIEGDAVRAVETAARELGGYNVLVNNAGFGTFRNLEDLQLEEMSSVLATNVLGAMLMARESARLFRRQSYGNIINIASTAAHRGFAGGTAYVASKFALTGMTECWRAELRKSNIRVMQVNPSEVVTNFFATAGGRQTASDRKLRPLEIAHAVLSMLEMDDRGFITDLTVWATNPDPGFQP